LASLKFTAYSRLDFVLVVVLVLIIGFFVIWKSRTRTGRITIVHFTGEIFTSTSTLR
jgi:hypothetical protein